MNNKTLIYALVLIGSLLGLLMIFSILNQSKQSQEEQSKKLIIQEATSHYNNIKELEIWHNKLIGIFKDNKLNEYSFDIYSLRPKNKENIAKGFAKEGLDYFEKNKNKNVYYSFDNKFNFIGKLETKNSCISCHSDFKVGELRGGININVPQENFNETIEVISSQYNKFYFMISIFYFITLAGLIYFIHKMFQHKENLEKLNDSENLNRVLNKKVHAKTKKLFDSRRELKGIISSINDFIWKVDKNGNYTYVSPQVKNILGYEPNEMVGKTPFDFMPSEEKENIQDLFHECVLNRTAVIQIVNKNTHKNGSTVYLETSGNPIYDEKNIFIGYIGTDRDVTEKIKNQLLIKENHKKIEILNEQLKEKIKKEVEKNQVKDEQLFAQSKMAAMGDMIANIAHQWRQPLSAISTTASGIKLKYEYDQLKIEELPNDMDLVVQNTQYLSETIDTFRDFIKEKKEYQFVNISNSINKSLKIVKNSLSNNYIELTNNLDEYPNIEIKTIPTELQQVVINIINNAKDALLNNNIKNPKINLNLSFNRNDAIIKIEDNAGGIPEDIIDRIFEPYFTTKHQSQGTGLGLHMVYRIVTESLKGKVYVENSSNGAIFFIVIPTKEVIK